MSASQAGLGPGLHRHHAMDESFYLLEGKVIITLDHTPITLQAGSSLIIPRGTIHSWQTVSPARMLILFSPNQNQAGYFAALAALHKQGRSWQESLPLLSAQFDNHLL